MFFGANSSLLPLAQTYLEPIRVVLPLFLFNQMLAAFLRNDGNPGLATAGVLAGGLFNIFGDYIFVFTFDMGIYGAGLATAIGSGLSFVVMLSHFWSKKNTLAFRKPTRVMRQLKEISITGFSTFFIDVAMGILTVLFNRQIMHYLGTSALAIYGPIVNVSTFVQCLRLQRGAGVPAHYIHQFRGAAVAENPGSPAVLPLHSGGIQHILDGPQPDLSQPLHLHLHETDG